MQYPTERKNNTLYWVITVIAVTGLLFTAITGLAHIQHITDGMTQLGYPLYVLNILGIWKFLAAITILVPNFKRLKEWAYAGVWFDLTGAVISRFITHGPPITIIVPLVLLSLTMTSWALRPANRKLAS
jgi:hypothetical protein